jgi:hypothetical protein
MATFPLDNLKIGKLKDLKMTNCDKRQDKPAKNKAH